MRRQFRALCWYHRIAPAALTGEDAVDTRVQDRLPRDALTQGLKDAVAVVAKVIDVKGNERYSSYLNAWFGDDARYRDIVKNVYKNLVGTNTNGEGADVLKVWNDDYYDLPNNMGKFCDYTTPAYLKTKDGNPSMHFCTREGKYYSRKNLADYLPNGSCGSVANPINTGTIGRAFRGAHEFMHYNEVGRTATGKQIGDIVYGKQNLPALLNPDILSKLFSSFSLLSLYVTL